MAEASARKFIEDMQKDQNKAGNDPDLNEAYWMKYYKSATTPVIRPSGNPMDKEVWMSMVKSDDIQMESHRLESIDSIQILAGGAAACVVFKCKSVFSYKGVQNNDLAVFTSTLERVGDSWKVVLAQRSTGSS